MNNKLKLMWFDNFKAILMMIFSQMLLSSSMTAQKKLNGYIILNKMDTVSGHILIPVKKNKLDFSEVNNSIQFLDDRGINKTYKPKNVIGFGIHDSDLNYDYVSCNINPPGMRKSYLFLKRVVGGKLQLFEDYYMNYILAGRNSEIHFPEPTTEYYVLIDSTLKQIPTGSGGNDLLNVDKLKLIFTDYPEILKQLTSNNIRWLDFKDIIMDYNRRQIN